MTLHTTVTADGAHVSTDTGHMQAATVVLEPGNSIAGSAASVAKDDQWVYVTCGQGYAYVGGRRIDLKPGSLLLIEAGEAHEICALGHAPLETISIHSSVHTRSSKS